MKTRTYFNRATENAPLEHSRRQIHFYKALHSEIRGDSSHSPMITPQYTERTGWLPGPLSYPWFLLFLTVPHILELLT